MLKGIFIIFALIGIAFTLNYIFPRHGGYEYTIADDQW